MRTEASVKVLRTLAELQDIRGVWESWPGHRDSEFDSYLASLGTNPRTVRPHVLVVYREGRPESILVGRIDLGHISCRLGYLRLNLPAKILCFVYGALRGNPSKENCDLIVSSVLQSLSDREADVAYMNFLREGSELCRFAKKKPGRLSRDYARSRSHIMPPLCRPALRNSIGAVAGVDGKQKRQAKKLLRNFSGTLPFAVFGR